jgi:hypothetical protein
MIAEDDPYRLVTCRSVVVAAGGPPVPTPGTKPAEPHSRTGVQEVHQPRRSLLVPARCPPCYAPGTCGEAGHDAQRGQQNAPRVAPRRRRCVLDAALGSDDYPIRPERQSPRLAAWKLRGQPPELRGCSAVQEPLRTHTQGEPPCRAVISRLLLPSGVRSAG